MPAAAGASPAHPDGLPNYDMYTDHGNRGFPFAEAGGQYEPVLFIESRFSRNRKDLKALMDLPGMWIDRVRETGNGIDPAEGITVEGS